MSGKIRIGLAGAGDIGRMHAKAWTQRPDVELCVCRGVNPARALALQRDFGARLYESWAAMLADEGLLAADICVPNDLHRVYVEQAAAAGKHILCEKPIALTLEDARAMAEAAGRAGVTLAIAHPLRFWPEYVRMREEIRSGRLGRCLSVTMRRMLSLLISVPGESGWRLAPERMGGAILDLQIHDLDFLCWTFGMPERIYCASVRSAAGGFDHNHALLHFPGGATALVESSYMLQGDPMIFTAKAVCERGSLDYGMDLKEFEMHEMAGPRAGSTERSAPATLVCYRPGRDPEILARQEPDVLGAAFAREVSHFLDCATGRAASRTAGPEEAIRALEVALACRRSAETGLPVRYQLVDMNSYS